MSTLIYKYQIPAPGTPHNPRRHTRLPGQLGRLEWKLTSLWLAFGRKTGLVELTEKFGLPRLFWRARKPVDFVPDPFHPLSVIGRKVDEITFRAGTYGQGGAGFFGLRMEGDWLIVALWSTGDWMTAQGRSVNDPFHKNHNRPAPWIDDMAEHKGDEDSSAEFYKNVVGQKITTLVVEQHSFELVLENGFDLTISEEPDLRPIFEGNGEERVLNEDEDLRDVVFIAPTASILI